MVIVGIDFAKNQGIDVEDHRREAVGLEGRAAHGSGVGAEIRGWRKLRENSMP